LPYGRTTEFQVTSPIIGTVDLTNAEDAEGAALPNTDIANPSTHVRIPQRSNLLLTTAFTLPGFDGSLRAFRTYKPVEDSTKPVGFKFVQDGTRLWVACAPGTTTTDAASLINAVRALPLGAMVDSTPAIMDPPSLDPPPDADYPGFADTNAD